MLLNVALCPVQGVRCSPLYAIIRANGFEERALRVLNGRFSLR